MKSAALLFFAAAVAAIAPRGALHSELSSGRQLTAAWQLHPLLALQTGEQICDGEEQAKRDKDCTAYSDCAGCVCDSRCGYCALGGLCTRFCVALDDDDCNGDSCAKSEYKCNLLRATAGTGQLKDAHGGVELDVAEWKSHPKWHKDRGVADKKKERAYSPYLEPRELPDVDTQAMPMVAHMGYDPVAP